MLQCKDYKLIVTLFFHNKQYTFISLAFQSKYIPRLSVLTQDGKLA